MYVDHTVHKTLGMLIIYTWKKVREHPDQFQAIFSLAKYYVFIFICDNNGLSYIY